MNNCLDHAGGDEHGRSTDAPMSKDSLRALLEDASGDRRACLSEYNVAQIIEGRWSSVSPKSWLHLARCGECRVEVLSLALKIFWGRKLILGLCAISAIGLCVLGALVLDWSSSRTSYQNMGSRHVLSPSPRIVQKTSAYNNDRTTEDPEKEPGVMQFSLQRGGANDEPTFGSFGIHARAEMVLIKVRRIHDEPGERMTEVDEVLFTLFSGNQPIAFSEILADQRETVLRAIAAESWPETISLVDTDSVILTELPPGQYSYILSTKAIKNTTIICEIWLAEKRKK